MVLLVKIGFLVIQGLCVLRRERKDDKKPLL